MWGEKGRRGATCPQSLSHSRAPLPSSSTPKFKPLPHLHTLPLLPHWAPCTAHSHAPPPSCNPATNRSSSLVPCRCRGPLPSGGKPHPHSPPKDVLLPRHWRHLCVGRQFRPCKSECIKQESNLAITVVVSFCFRVQWPQADVVVIESRLDGLCCVGLLARYDQEVVVLESHDQPSGAAHLFDH